MATLRQKKVAKLIVDNMDLPNPLNKGELLEKVRYSKGIQQQPSRVIESKGVTDELALLGFTPEAAKSVVSEIMNNGDVEPNARLKAADMTFKVHGSYAPEKSLTVNINAGPSDEDVRLAKLINDIRRNSTTNGGRPVPPAPGGGDGGGHRQGEGGVAEPVGGEA